MPNELAAKLRISATTFLGCAMIAVVAATIFRVL